MLFVDPSEPTPIYAQLERAIRAEIATGELRVGDRLPTVRQLAVDLRINANTVAKVYAELGRSGVLSTQRGVGTFVRRPEGSQSAQAAPGDRDRVLHQLTNRFLAEAQAAGISIDQIIRHLEHRQTKETT